MMGHREYLKGYRYERITGKYLKKRSTKKARGTCKRIIRAAMLVSILALTGCPRPVPRPLPPLPALDGICEPGILACEARVDKDVCAAALACVDSREVGQLCHSRLKACEALAAVDVGEQAAYRAAAEARVGELEDQRWWWGVGGLVLGGLVAGLVAGLAR